MVNGGSQQTNAGYWDEPGKTAEVFRRDGFVLSGDWAKIDEEGDLWLLMADGAALTPRDALAALEADDTLGRRIGELVAEGGVVALTKPNEARFRR